MKSLQHIALSFFLAAIIILTVIFLASMWGLLADRGDFAGKVALTFFVLIISAGIILVAGKVARKDQEGAEDEASTKFISGLGKFRRLISGIIVVASVLLAFVAIFTAWEIVGDETMFFKILGSLGVFAVSGFVIGVTCLIGEKKLDIFAERERGLSIWKILSIIIVIVVLHTLFSMFMSLFFFSRPYFY